MKKLQLHPFTWWIWAIGLSIASIRLDNPLISLACVGAVALIVVSQRSSDPWSKSFNWTLKLSAWILFVRTIIGIIIGVPIPGKVLFSIPVIPLPSWMPGIRIGGNVTAERLISSLSEGVIICSVIIFFGAATSLTSPHKLLKVLPIYIYEFGVSVVIATSVLPQLVASISRIRQAQRLRGQKLRGFYSWKRVAIPLLEESLARSLDLAASMDSRGYGISRNRSTYKPFTWKLSDLVVIGSALIVVGLS